jgi:hypothetical protein
MIWAVALGLAVAACGPPKAKTEPGESPLSAFAPKGFPRPTASYEAKYNVYDDSGSPREMTIYAAGARMRVESAPPPEVKNQAYRMATVLDPATKRMLSFRAGADAPKVAMVMSYEKLGAAARFFDLDKDRPAAKVVGADTVAGIRCRVWEVTPAGGGAADEQTCVTDDGIFLRSKKVGAATPEIEATEVHKGAQDASLFAAPGDYEVVDFAPCMTLMQDAMAAARAGKRPDVAKVEQCRKLGEKASEIFGR